MASIAKLISLSYNKKPKIDCNLWCLNSIKNEKCETAKAILEQNLVTDINCDDLQNQSLLIWASHMGYFDIASMLINYGANVNHTSNSGATALMNACNSSRYDIVRLLVSNGANINIADINGKTAHDFANDKCKLLLIPETNPVDIKKSTELEEVISILQTLKYYKLDCDNILMEFICENDPTYALKMLEMDMVKNIDYSDMRKQSLLIIAAYHGHVDIVKILLDKGANINHQSIGKYTALMNACTRSKADIVKILLDKGADINIRNCNGRTAFDYANPECKMLLKQLVKAQIDMVYQKKHNPKSTIGMINGECCVKVWIDNKWTDATITFDLTKIQYPIESTDKIEYHVMPKLDNYASNSDSTFIKFSPGTYIHSDSTCGLLGNIYRQQY